MEYQSLDDFIRDLPYHAAKHADKLRGHDAHFLLQTKQGRTLHVCLENGSVTTSEASDCKPDCTVTADEQLLLDVIRGKVNPVKAIVLRKIVVSGNPAKLMGLLALL